jgi:hypothetical protein
VDLKQDQEYTTEEINHCINILTNLVNNSEAFIASPKEKQIELMKIAGQLSRPDCNQLNQRKNATVLIYSNSNRMCMIFSRRWISLTVLPGYAIRFSIASILVSTGVANF